MKIDIAGGIRQWFRHAWIVLSMAAIVIAFDQWTKILVRDNIPMYGAVYPFPALGRYVYFEHVYNYGAAFGMFQQGGTFFIVIAILVSIGILTYVRYLPLNQQFVRIMLGLQMGGAIGNVIDRIYQGYVTDFIKTGIPDFYYIPTWNVADSAIVVGVIGLGIYIVRDDIRRQRAESTEHADNAQSKTQAGDSSVEPG